mmetsp:Transcript_73032/g.126670  ORF Transcript_73032/g.126670 Transcript_73032/m.126670 type:complete len:206 (-) Transcript_73032:175-792(-)
MLCTKLRLCDPGTHDASGREAAGDNVAHLIHDLRSTPLLVGKGLHTKLTLLTLDELHVGCCTLGCVCLGKSVNGKGIAMKARQGDELPTEAKLSQIPDEALHLRIGHTRGIPVEGWAQVVCKHLVWHCSPDFLSELLGLAQNWLAGLHPESISIRRIRDRTLDAELRGALDPVVALNGAGRLPIKEDITCTKLCRSSLHLSERHL